MLRQMGVSYHKTWKLVHVSRPCSMTCVKFNWLYHLICQIIREYGFKVVCICYEEIPAGP
jgi:hypothetical protein